MKQRSKIEGKTKTLRDRNVDNIIRDLADLIQNSSKRLVATLREETGDRDPVQVDIENNIDGEPIVWTSLGLGTYQGVKVGAFVSGQYSIQNLKPSTSTYPLYQARFERKDDDTVILSVSYAETDRDVPLPSDGKLDDIFDWKFEYIQKSV